MRNGIRLIGLAALAAVCVSCGDVVRQGSSPVFLVIDSLQGIRGAVQPGTAASTLVSDVITNVTSPDPCTPASPCPTIFGDSGSVTLRAPLKDQGYGTALTPTVNNEVTINRYHVEYVRSDGRNTQGVDVPFAFDGAVTLTIADAGSVGFTLVRIQAKQEAPLKALALHRGAEAISTVAHVTFYGHDQAGREVSVTGNIEVDFADWAG
jgi:hypothetical protein